MKIAVQISCLVLFLGLFACNETNENPEKDEVKIEGKGEDLLDVDELIEDGPYEYSASPTVDKLVLKINFNRGDESYHSEILSYCDAHDISLQTLHGDLGGAEIGTGVDGVWFDLSKYNSYGKGYLVCTLEDLYAEIGGKQANIKFLPSGSAQQVISEIKKCYQNRDTI